MSEIWSESPTSGLLAFQSDARVTAACGRPIAFLDRDGTLNALVPDPSSGLPESPLHIEDVRLLPGAASAIRELVSHGYAVVCVTNQPAAAKGKLGVEDLLSVHEHVCTLLGELGAHLDASRVCLHHPEGTVDPLARSCDCRKPAPEMLLDAAATLQSHLTQSWMLGDTDADVAAGRAIGSGTVLIETPASAHKRSQNSRPDLRAPDIAKGVTQLLSRNSHQGA